MPTLTDLLQCESAPVTLNAPNARLFFADGTREWVVLAQQGRRLVELARSADLDRACAAFYDFVVKGDGYAAHQT